MNEMPKGLLLRAALIDLDDTLYPHVQFAECALKAAAREFQKRTGVRAVNFFTEAWHNYALNGSRDNQVFSRIMRDHRCYTKELENMIVEAYRGCQPKLKPYAGVVLWLEKLRKQGIMLGMITDGRSEVQRAKIRDLGIAPFFDEIVVTGDFGPDWAKPATYGFELLLSRFACKPSEAVMIGDDPHADGAGARALGVPMIRVRQGRYLRDDDFDVAAEFADIATAFSWVFHLRRAHHEAT